MKSISILSIWLFFIVGITSSACFALAPPPAPPEPPVSDSGSENDLAIPGNRIVGVPGMDHIETNTSAWNVVTYSGGDISSLIQSVADETIIQVADGIYVDQPITIRRSNVVVRGNCTNPDNVVFRATVNDPGNILWSDRVCGPAAVQMCSDHPPGPPTPWISGHTEGSRVLTLSDTSGIAVGDWLQLESEALPGSIDHFMKILEVIPNFYIAKALSKAGNQITIDRALPIDFVPSSASASLFHPIENVGVECIRVEHINPTTDNFYYNPMYQIGYTTNSWITNSHFGDWFNTYGDLFYSARFLFSGNQIGNQLKEAPWNKTSLSIANSYDSSIINNSFEGVIGVQVNNYSAQNWIAFNYFSDTPYNPAGENHRCLFFHGGYAYSNLVEGNDCRGGGTIEMDQYWGKHGPRNTFYRNRADGFRFEHFGACGADGSECTVIADQTNFLLNFAYGTANLYSSGFVAPMSWTGKFDEESPNMWLEKNLAVLPIPLGASASTTDMQNHIGNTAPVEWLDLNFPNTLILNQTIQPAFWCQETVSNGGPVCDFSVYTGIGALGGETSCKLPAQHMKDGGICTLIE